MKKLWIGHSWCIIFQLIGCLTLIGGKESTAQTLQVVTKAIERTFEYKPHQTLQIYAERSDIELSTWNRPEIKVSLELIAKHPDRAVAEKDLEVLRYVAENSGKIISLRNFVVLNTNRPKPQSNLKARYVLWVPATCQVEIQNSFGKTLLRGLQKDTRLRTEFGTTEATELKGRLTLNVRFGEVKVIDFEGDMTLAADRADVLIRAPRGECHIRTQYGSLDLQADPIQVKLDLETKHTDMRKGTVAKK